MGSLRLIARSRLAAFVAAAALMSLIAACGGGDDAGDSGGATASSFAGVTSGAELCDALDADALFAAIGVDNGTTRVSSPNRVRCALNGDIEGAETFFLSIEIVDDGFDTAAAAVDPDTIVDPDVGAPEGSLVYIDGSNPAALVDVGDSTVLILDRTSPSSARDTAHVVTAVEVILG